MIWVLGFFFIWVLGYIILLGRYIILMSRIGKIKVGMLEVL